VVYKATQSTDQPPLYLRDMINNVFRFFVKLGTIQMIYLAIS